MSESLSICVPGGITSIDFGMVYLFVGTGQAGSAIVDTIFEYRRLRMIASPLVFNSTIRDLENLSNVSPENWFGISDDVGIVPGTQPGFEERVTGGFGRNPRRADEVMSDTQGELVPMLRERFGDDGTVPFAFVFLGLGGGTGCGIAPHIAEAIRVYASGDVKIIAVGVLPNTEGPIGTEDDEVSAGRQARNTTYGLDRLEETVDGIVLVDNQRLAYEDAAEGRFAEYNEYVADAFIDLVSGPVLEGIDPGDYDDVDAPIVDLQDVVTSISFGDGSRTRPGYASIGRSVSMTKSLPGYLVPFIGNKQVDGATLSRLATRKQTLSEVDVADARKAIGLIRAPPRYISNETYRIDVSVVRRYLQDHCSEVNLGMTLTERNLASCTTLFTFEREDVARLAEIETHADAYAEP